MVEIHPKRSEGDGQDPSRDGSARRRKRRTTHETRPSREAGEVPTGTMAMAVAMSHPLRVRILYGMHSPVRRRSATDIAEETGVDVKRISYHMRELATMGFIEQVDERPVRGSLEKIFAPIKRLEAWDLEYSQIPPALKQIISASTLKLGIDALGAAINSGTFDSREDSMLGQDTFLTDERGAMEAMEVLDVAVKRLLEVQASAEARLAETGEQGLLISYLIAGYEGSLRPV